MNTYRTGLYGKKAEAIVLIASKLGSFGGVDRISFKMYYDDDVDVFVERELEVCNWKFTNVLLSLDAKTKKTFNQLDLCVGNIFLSQEDEVCILDLTSTLSSGVDRNLLSNMQLLRNFIRNEVGTRSFKVKVRTWLKSSICYDNWKRDIRVETPSMNTDVEMRDRDLKQMIEAFHGHIIGSNVRNEFTTPNPNILETEASRILKNRFDENLKEFVTRSIEIGNSFKQMYEKFWTDCNDSLKKFEI